MLLSPHQQLQQDDFWQGSFIHLVLSGYFNLSDNFTISIFVTSSLLLSQSTTHLTSLIRAYLTTIGSVIFIPSLVETVAICLQKFLS